MVNWMLSLWILFILNTCLHETIATQWREDTDDHLGDLRDTQHFSITFDFNNFLWQFSLIYPRVRNMQFKYTSCALLVVLLCISFTSHLVRARSLKGGCLLLRLFSHYTVYIVWRPIRYVTLHFRVQGDAASLRYRNRAEISILMCPAFLCPVRYGFHSRAEAFWYRVNISWGLRNKHRLRIWTLIKGVINFLSWQTLSSS